MIFNLSRSRAPGRKHGRGNWRPKLEHLEDRAVPTNLPPGFSETLFSSGVGDAACLEFAPDGRAFVCQTHGDLEVIQPNGVVNPEPFLHVDTNFEGEHGLVGLAFDPYFAQNRYLYVYYTMPTEPNHCRVSRFTASATNPDVVEPGSEVVILELDDLTNILHVGGDLHFGRDGKLYISVGEDGNGANSQDGSNLHGKMLRINPDGTIPADNPFVNVPGVRGEIYAFGLRNPYRFAVHPRYNLMYINDVGSNEPVAIEEVNRLWWGGNYGWPIYEGVSNNPDYTDPIYTYPHGTDPETGGFNCAVTGALFYGPGEQPFPRPYMGDYFFTDLCGNWIRRYDVNTGQVNVFASDTDTLTVELAEDFKGNLYYLSLSGNIHQIKYSPGFIPPPGLDLTAATLELSPLRPTVITAPPTESILRNRATDSAWISSQRKAPKPAEMGTEHRRQLRRHQDAPSDLTLEIGLLGEWR